MLKSLLLAAAMAAGLGAAAAAGDVTATDAYARVSGAMAKSGAVFLVLSNAGTSDDTLIAAATPAAERAELHTHLQDADGVMRMVKVEDGFVVPAGGSHPLARGGDHLMLLGLAAPLKDGDRFPLTLTFATAGDVTIDVVVDSARDTAPAGQGMDMDMGQGMGMGNGHGGHGMGMGQGAGN